MKILVGIPVISSPEMCKLAIDSVVDEADVLVMDNGAGDDMREMLKHYTFNLDVLIGRNHTNIYVNSCWGQILEYFLQTDYDTLIIMNSDLILAPRWSDQLEEGVLCIPTDGSHKEDVVVTEGTPGVFIQLTKDMAKIVYPLPDYIKIWFGDLFIFSVLRGLGYKTIVKAGLVGNHYYGGSQSVNIVPDKDKIIEEDKVQWALHGEKDIQERIEYGKSICISV